MKWNFNSAIAILASSLLFAACQRAPETEVTSPALPRIADESIAITKKPTLAQRLKEASFDEHRTELLADSVLEAPDDALPDQLRVIQELDDPKASAELLTTFYDQLDFRVTPVRLPLLLEIARSSNANDSFRTSLLAELGAILQADHGASWDAWALTLQGYLAKEHGILDSRAAEE